MIESNDSYKVFSLFYDSYIGDWFSDDFQFYRFFCKPEQKIMEIGCGTGRILAFFLKHNYQLTGVDISDEMINIANDKLRT